MKAALPGSEEVRLFGMFGVMFYKCMPDRAEAMLWILFVLLSVFR